MSKKSILNNWRRRFRSLLDSTLSIECVFCGNSLIGDGPANPVICVDCFSHPGVILNDCTICMNCAADEMSSGTLVTKTTHPDGFTCAECCKVVTV